MVVFSVFRDKVMCPVGKDPIAYLLEGGLSILVALLAESGKELMPHLDTTSMRKLADQLAQLHEQETKVDKELEASSTKLRRLQEGCQVLAEVDELIQSHHANTQVPQAKRPCRAPYDPVLFVKYIRNPWSAAGVKYTFEEWAKATNSVAPAGKSICLRVRNYGSPLEAMVTSPGAPASLPEMVAQAALYRLKALNQTSTAMECECATKEVNKLQSELAEIHKQQRDAHLASLEAWRVTLTQEATHQQLQSVQEQLAAKSAEMSQAYIHLGYGITAMDAANALIDKLRLEAQQRPAVSVSFAVQQPSISLQLAVQQPAIQLSVNLDHESRGQVQQLQQQVADLQAELAACRQQQQQPPVQVTFKLQADASALADMAAKLAAAEAAVTALQQQQQQSPAELTNKPADLAAAAPASLSVAPAVPKAMQDDVQPSTPVIRQDTSGQLQWAGKTLVVGRYRPSSSSSSSTGDSRRTSCDTGSVQSSCGRRYSSVADSRRSSLQREGSNAGSCMYVSQMAPLQTAAGHLTGRQQQPKQQQQEGGPVSLTSAAVQELNRLVSFGAAAVGWQQTSSGGSSPTGSRSSSSGSLHSMFTSYWQGSAAAEAGAADQCSMQENQRSGGSCGGTAVCDTAAAESVGNAAAAKANAYAAGGSSVVSSAQYSPPNLSLTAPAAAASFADSVSFMPEVTAQLGRWANAWM